MSVLFHLARLTLYSASACFILIYFHEILMLSNARNATQLHLLFDDTETHETLYNLSSIQLGSNDANIFPVTIIGLKSMDNHGLKTGLHFFSFWKVNKQNKHLQVIW